MKKHFLIALLLVVVTWLMTGISEDDEFSGEYNIFLKHKPSTQFYFTSPLGMQDMPADYPLKLQIKEMVYDDFVWGTHWSSKLDFIAVILSIITVLYTCYMLMKLLKIYKNKTIVLGILLVCTLVSCKKQINDLPETKSIKVRTNEENGLQNNDTPSQEITPKTPLKYPKKGKKPADFNPDPKNYEIQFESYGDLNSDHKKDVVIVLKHKWDKTEGRTVLVLLQNENKEYILDKISDLAMPAEYTNEEFENYSAQDVTIEKGVLQINLYGSGGPSGNIFSHYKYVEKELLLTYIETYNAGAGSWQNLYYDLEKGELTQEVTNTMKEDMPTETKTIKLEKEVYFFENTSADEVIINVYKKIDSDW